VRTYQGGVRLRTRELGFLLVATALHGALLLTGRHLRRPELPTAARASEAEVEIELRPEPLLRLRDEEERAARRSVGGVAAREEAERPARNELSPRREAREPGPTAPADLEGAPPEAPPEPAPPVPDEYGGAPGAGGVPGVAGLNGVPVWQLPGVLQEGGRPASAPTAPPAPREISADRAGELIREAMREKDKSMGLDLPAAGTVASVLAEAVRSSDTPNDARATFEVQLSGSGEVLGIRATSSSSGAADLWAKVARAAAARLTGRALAMTAAFVKGAKVYVTVSSAQRMPSGARSGSSVSRQGVGLAFDVSDIGAHATRVVSSSFRVVAVD
jgi:hypothetical protein